MGAALQGDLSNTAHRLPDPQAVQSWKHGEARATVTVVEHSVERSFHTYDATAFTPLRNVKSGAGHQSSAKCMSRFVFIECGNDGVLALARNVSVPICTRIGRSVAYWEWFLVCCLFLFGCTDSPLPLSHREMRIVLLSLIVSCVTMAVKSGRIVTSSVVSVGPVFV